MLNNFFHLIGSVSILFLQESGKITLLLWKAVLLIFQRPFNLIDILRQIELVKKYYHAYQW